jgi:hypothetical protein
MAHIVISEKRNSAYWNVSRRLSWEVLDLKWTCHTRCVSDMRSQCYHGAMVQRFAYPKNTHEFISSDGSIPDILILYFFFFWETNTVFPITCSFRALADMVKRKKNFLVIRGLIYIRPAFLVLIKAQRRYRSTMFQMPPGRAQKQNHSEIWSGLNNWIDTLQKNGKQKGAQRRKISRSEWVD